ncbi:bifunctional metallophosphatase/5'-nucleotidase [Pseudomonas sp. 148P]|uniref:Bifunctional metallophosphatase/5'-nucleotidase n=1 Tax=Pseudomonas ulcerans TaxID=3115852 RepID=A0ABU7HXL9_9PSED|nr:MULTISPECIES: bifunctional metallophosphatase/5'-nucleotidase [unclassified Pseudomonas]MEE1922145.1 bifunctional metallophosphatase/5'-nucleotidase [Pseudomonas sp. 147P]MEE1936304.1 bifunctional metallophosphatase/5'-nucleotidase [Pseudomonas sp. 148P]
MSRASNAVRPLSLLLAAMLLASGCEKAPAPVEVTVAALNDFHGNLLASPFQYPDATGTVKLKAGGLGPLSGALAELRQQDPQLLLIGAGDMVGGSPPISSMWADEPSLKALNLLGLKFSVVGNHELDHGKAELLRQVNGGCDSDRADKACQFDKDFKGAGFPYISANLMDKQSGKPVFAGYRIEEAHGARIAFVGATLRNVGAYVSARNMDDLYTVDEAEAINALLTELRQQQVDAIVAVIHQGGATPERFDQQECSQLGGDVVDVARRLDPQIKVVVTAHTHEGYLCRLGDKLVTQGASFGRLLTHLTLTVDTTKHQLLDVKAENLVVDAQRYSATAQVAPLLAEVESRSQAQLGKPVARLAAREVLRATNEAGESAMGDLIADSQLAATRALGAQVALMNQGGMRMDISLDEGQEQVNYGQVATVQPFNNSLTLLTLSGAQLKELLEQQWQDGGMGFYPLQPSASLTYRYDDSRPKGQRVLADSLRVDGQPVQPEQDYRIAMNSFLAEGGDNFGVLKQARDRLDTGINDLEAMIAYLQERDRAGQPAGFAEAGQRIQKASAEVASNAP